MSKIKQIWQKIKPRLKEKKVIFGLLIVVIIILFAFKGDKENPDNSYVANKTDLVKSVSVAGKVVSLQNVELAFETSGMVSRVYKNTGDSVYAGESIAALRAGELAASRDRAQADLDEQEAELLKLKSTEGGNTEVAANKQLVVNAIEEAWTNADDAIHSKVDQFFEFPKSTTPNIKYRFDNYSSTFDNINDGRTDIEKVLQSFEEDVNNLSAESYTQSHFDRAYSNLLAVKKFLDLVAPAVNTFEEEGDLTVAKIDEYRTDLASARANINSSLSELTSIKKDLRSSVSNIPVQEARVKAAQAEVRNIDAQLAQTVLRAPFSGVVSFQEAKEGESVAANEHVVSLITNSVIIEAFVPEVNIPGIQIDNKVKVTIDAYDGEVFDAVVTYIDPAETEKDGVSNYKIKLAFSKEDPRIRPGMTADVKIETGRRPDALLIPQRFVVTTEGVSKVFVSKGKDTTEQVVTLGEKDSFGNVEIISGLSVGDKVVTPQ